VTATDYIQAALVGVVFLAIVWYVVFRSASPTCQHGFSKDDRCDECDDIRQNKVM
jgi:hypothetical protein